MCVNPSVCSLANEAVCVILPHECACVTPPFVFILDEDAVCVWERSLYVCVRELILRLLLGTSVHVFA